MSQAEARIGRPPKVDEHGVATRERLLAAAAASCVEHGFDGATLSDIAARAGVSGPSVYNHFDGKVHLLVAAGRTALDELGEAGRERRPSAAQVAETYLSPGFARSRRLLAELHLASLRYPEVAALLAEWHAEQAAIWRPARGRDRDAAVKLFFSFLLGLCQIDTLEAVPASHGSLVRLARQVASRFFGDDAGDA